MKKILLSLFLLGILVSASAQVPSYVPSNGLVGWWPFNGNANDQSGNGNNGSINGATASKDRFGNSNASYSFNGTNQWIDVANNNNLNPSSQLTISVWIESIANHTNSGVVGKYNNFNGSTGNGQEQYAIHVNGAGLRLLTKTTIQKEVVEPNVVYNNGNWHHYVGVWNGSTMQLYRDNALVSSVSQTGSISSYNQKLEFGRYAGGQDNSFFNGKIDDIGIWNRALTASEIADLFNACSNLSISTEPTNQSASINNQAQFSSLASDTTASYQWQSNQSNLGWVNIPSNSFYSGVTSKKLSVNNIKVKNHEQLFRVIATKNTCKDTSVVAMLTVNDTCITSTTDTLYIKVNTSSLSNPVYNTVKVYPNPSSTQVIIDNGNYSSMGTYTAKIVNALGQQVFQSTINQQQFVIDANTMGGAGVYTLYIIDANSKVVGVKKIVLQ